MHDAVQIALIGASGVTFAVIKDVWVRVRTEAVEKAIRFEQHAQEVFAAAAAVGVVAELAEVTEDRDRLRFTTIALPEFLIQQIKELQEEKCALEKANCALAAGKLTAEMRAYDLEEQKRRQQDDSPKQPEGRNTDHI